MLWALLKEDGLYAPNEVAELEALEAKMLDVRGDLAAFVHEFFGCLAELEERKLWRSGGRKGKDSLCNSEL